MEEALEFPALLRLIDERSIAFRAAVMSAPGLELHVPTCPEWTLLDLVQHLGAVHRFWAAAVNAGPAAAPPAESVSERAKTAPRSASPCWHGRPHRRSSSWMRYARPARIAVAGRGGVHRSRRRHPALSPGTSSRRLRCTPTTLYLTCLLMYDPRFP